MWNGPLVAPLKGSQLPTKMATKLKIEKRGMIFLKKSSLMKLLSQSQPNFAEMILVTISSKYSSY
jgi:hypothetical protein